VRNGPNPVVAPDPASYDWFVGDGMVHGVRLEEGRARWYRNRWVRSRLVARALGEQPRSGPVHADMDFAPNTHGPHPSQRDDRDEGLADDARVLAD
jgi:carotenoid cleavage dioxygenase